jgi:thiol-disulfide isomerase/thioredoxin
LKRFLTFFILFLSLLNAQFGTAPPLKFKLINGQSVMLKNLIEEGPVLIDYWALWCGPCLKEMPHLEKLQDDFGDDGFRIIAVNLDTERSVSKVKSYVRSKGYRLGIALDPAKETYRRLNGTAMPLLPYSVLVNRSGKTVYRHSGYAPGDEKILRKKVEALVHAPSDNF